VASEGRDRVLRRLRGRKFERIRYRAQDALVAPVPASGPSRGIRAAIAGADCRYYPRKDGTYVVKWPYAGGAPPRGARIERGGWDHEHCAACERHILPGRTFWQTARGSCFWLCPYCYRALRALRGR
jgi:hypothetical protein